MMLHPIRGRIMDVDGLLWGGVALMMREAALFAASGFLLLGVGDLAVDLLWLWIRGRSLGATTEAASEVEPSSSPGLLAVFIPAWDESAIIAPMLRGTLQAFAGADVRLYVGCYPNDPATIAAVDEVADPRVRLAVGRRDGPTTKADCLNRLWEALIADEAGIM
jgi:adsorption protein B